MFGIDIGISVSSVSLITAKGEILDTWILFGNKNIKNDWKRITQMATAVSDAITDIGKSHAGTHISPLVAIEEPVFPYRTRNPKSYFCMCCLYALIRNRLAARHFKIYSIHPHSVKATAKAMAFQGKRLKKLYAKKGALTKKGMIRAFKKVVGRDPDYHTMVGKETLADSYFIAHTGLDRRRVGLSK